MTMPWSLIQVYLLLFITSSPLFREVECYNLDINMVIIRTSRRYGIGHAHNVKEKILEVRKELGKLELDTTTQTTEAENNLTEARLRFELDNLLNEEVTITSLSAKTTSADTTEQMTKLFFQSHKSKKQKEFITAINTTDGVARTQTEITRAICDFYKSLYDMREVNNSQIDKLLKTIKKKVQTHDYIKMNEPISPQEVTAAIRSIGIDKAPGPLAKLYQKFIEIEEIASEISNANINLLYNKGGKQDIGNWRPISLLNVDYKILAKIISERMRACLPKILHSDQKGFVPTRNLEDAVIKAQSLIEYCQLEKLPKYMLLLDQEKAFDRVSREYMHKIIKEFNFPPLIVKAIMAMLTLNIC